MFIDSLPYADAIPYRELALRVPVMEELIARLERSTARNAVKGGTLPPRADADGATPTGANGALMAHLRAVRPSVSCS